MTTPTHLIEDSFQKAFPSSPDEFPTVVDGEHYIDAWLFNSLFSSLLITEQYLIDHQANIEAPLGDDVLGEDGRLEISIPPARYPAYKSTMAWDSNLFEENIAAGVTIFGVAGSMVGGGGLPSVALLPLFFVPFIVGPAISLDSAVPASTLLSIST